MKTSDERDHDRSGSTNETFETSRRILLLGAGTALAGGLAGCSEDGGNGDDADDSDGDDNPDDSNGDTETDGSDSDDDSTTADDSDGTDGPGSGGGGEVTGSVAENAIDGIEVTDMESEIDGGSLKVYVTFENTGDQTIPQEAFEQPYKWEIVIYDPDGNVIEDDTDPGVFWWETSEDIEPGDTGGINLKSTQGRNANFGSYEVTIKCHEDKDDPYC
jgi:hypothetical protein